MYKILRVVFDSNGSENETFDLPEGYSVQNTIFATDSHAVFVIFKPDPQPVYDRHPERPYNTTAITYQQPPTGTY